jgi:hypothetical protein
MDAPDILTLALTAHGAVALIVISGGLPHYAERADTHGKAMQETEDLLSRISHQISSALETGLTDLFRDDGSTSPNIIVVQSDEHRPQASYSERPTAVVGSDRFREYIRAFMLGNVKAITDYRAIVDAHRAWCRWAQRRCWGVYGIGVWELLCLFGLGLAGKLGGIPFGRSQILWSFVPTTLLAVWFLLSEFMLISRQSVIDDRRERHHDF